MPLAGNVAVNWESAWCVIERCGLVVVIVVEREAPPASIGQLKDGIERRPQPARDDLTGDLVARAPREA